MRKLAIYLKPFKIQCSVGPLCKLIEAILELLLPTIMAFVINEGVVKNNTQVVMILGGVMIFMVIIAFGFSMICQYHAALASQGFGTNLRNAMMQHISSFSFQDIDHFTTSSLSNRLSNDIQQLQVAIAMLIRLVIRSPFIVIGAVVMSMFLDVRLSLILIATIPFIAGILFIFIRYSSPLYHAYQKKLDRFAEILDDNFSGVRVIRAFVSQRKEKQTFDAQVDDLSKQMMKVSRCSALLSPLTALVVNGAIVFLLWTGIIEIHTGTMDPGTIIAFINYATSILIALIATSNLIVIFTKASASAQRVNEVLEYAPSMKEGHEQLTNTKDKEYAITFDHVSFSYDDSERSLEDISFSIRPNETIGIIGGTGSGKSTLVHLMARFYDATDGHVSFYGHPIQTLTNNSIRDHIAIVSQTCELFNDTILQNITLHKDYATKDIEKALCDVQAMDFIQEMKDGLHTMLTRGGANLSGGQKQRLCIARALLRRADILILDDACSALDFKTDAMLRKALRSYPMTRIIVSQRVGTLLDCNRILVLHDGKLVGFDTHTNLYDTCDVYQEICQTQAIGRDAS